MSIKYVDDKFLAERYKAGRRTIWRRAKDGHLPKPVKLSPVCTRWRLDEIEAHEAKLAAERESA
jgi:predicted DNA-binding transcriptional regulator AlpA